MCYGDCPLNSHCEWGYCECDQGFVKFKGRCHSKFQKLEEIDAEDITGENCSIQVQCSHYDINFDCHNGQCR